MGNNHDYQNAMSVDTRAIDTAGEQAAEAIDAETAPVREEKIVTETDNAKYTKTLGTFGVLPGLEISTDYTQERMFYFKNMAIETGTKRNPLNPMESASKTAAFKSQDRMANAYLEDLSLITTAQRHYDLLVPVSSMAAKSFAKAHEIGQLTGLSDQKGPQLSTKEQRALNKASRNLHTPLDQENSLDAVSDEMIRARHGMDKASKELAAKVQTNVVKELLKEYEQAATDKAAIQAKIQHAQQIVAYLGTAASMIAGGAGFVHENISVGKPHPLAGKSPEEYDLRNSDVEATHKGAEQAKSASGPAAGAVAFGMQLYHEKELTKIEQTMGVIGGMLAAEKDRAKKAEIDAAYLEFYDKQAHYRETVIKYESRVNDRRKNMANLGSEADKIVDKSGSNSNASDAMLWTASIMETQSFVSTAIDAARDAQSNVGASYKKVLEHRRQHWGTLGDVYGPTNTPRSEGESGPDLGTLKNMRNLVSLWLEGAEDVAKTIDKVAESQGEPTLEMVGFTGKY